MKVRATSSPEAAFLEALTRLGVPSGVATGFLAPKTEPALKAALRDKLGVDRASPIDLDQAPGPLLELIVSRGVLDRTSLSDLPELVAALRERLIVGGMLALDIRTAFAPLGTISARELDHALFPQLAALGQLDDEANALTPLPATAWLNLLGRSGFAIQGVAGYGETPVALDIATLHGERLALFDATELQSGRLVVTAIRAEEPA